MPRVHIGLVVVLLFASLRHGTAQSQAYEQPPHWDLSVFASGATGEESTNSFAEAQILTVGVSIGRMLNRDSRHWYRGRWEYGFDLVPLFVQFTPDHIHGIAFDPVIVRWHSNARIGRAMPFLELGGGGLRTSTNFPSGDTSSFNFIARGGGGVQMAAGPGRAIELACQWWHISNANLGNRNPEFNGIQLSFGYHWFK